MYRSYKNECIDVHIDRYIMVFKWSLCYAFVLEPHPLPCVCLFVSNIYIYIYIYNDGYNSLVYLENIEYLSIIISNIS